MALGSIGSLLGGPTPTRAPSPFKTAGKLVSSVPQQAASALGYKPPPSPLQAAYGSYLAAAQPDFLGLQLSNNAYNRGMGYAYQGQAVDQQGLRNDYSSQLGDINTQISQNQVDLGAANRQIPYLNTLQQLGNELMNMKAGTDRRNLNSTATAQGAFVSSGANDQRKDIYANLINSLKTSDTQYDEKRASAMDSKKKLELEASNLNMKPGQLKATLDNGLAKLGLQTAMSVADLMDGLAKNDLTAKKIYASILQNAQQYAGAFG